MLATAVLGGCHFRRVTLNFPKPMKSKLTEASGSEPRLVLLLLGEHYALWDLPSQEASVGRGGELWAHARPSSWQSTERFGTCRHEEHQRGALGACAVEEPRPGCGSVPHRPAR